VHLSSNPFMVNFIDRIVFNIGSGTPPPGPQTPTIELLSALPPIGEAVTIDGATGGARRVEITGRRIVGLAGFPVHGIVVAGSYSTLKSLVINGFRGDGILLTYLNEEKRPELDPPGPERPGEKWTPPCESQTLQTDPEECRADRTGNSDPHMVNAGGVGGHTILDNLIGTDATGTVAVPNGDGSLGSAGIVVLSPANTIGGSGRRMGNTVSGHRGNGILLDERNNRVLGNTIGGRAGNQLSGVFVDGGETQTASCEIRGNTIVANGANGVDAAYNLCWILSNSITANGGLGIERAGPGPTMNHATGQRRWPPNFPVVQAITTLPTGETRVFGEILQTSRYPVALHLFESRDCDPSSHGEGATLVATTIPQGTLFMFRFQQPAITFSGTHYYTATATTEETGTSEFSVCFPH
jgi:hypothetical protein